MQRHNKSANVAFLENIYTPCSKKSNVKKRLKKENRKRKRKLKSSHEKARIEREKSRMMRKKVQNESSQEKIQHFVLDVFDQEDKEFNEFMEELLLESFRDIY